MIGGVPVQIRTPDEAAEHFGVQVDQYQVGWVSGRGEPATKIFFGRSLEVGAD